MDHIVFFSSGAASWATAKRVAASQGTENLKLLFTDTLNEDADNYRFLIEGAANVLGAEISLTLRQWAAAVPPVWEIEARKEEIPKLAERAMEELPGLVWLIDGRDVWDVFRDVRYIGNNRVDPCSRVLKRESARKWIKTNYNALPANEACLYLGLDWSEEHRGDAPRQHWFPFQVRYPLMERPLLTKQDILDWAELDGVNPPQMYSEEFDHANCAGFCVKTGQGQFYRLLMNRPEVYAYHERRQEEVMEQTGITNGFIRKTIDKELHYLTLRQFREQVQGGEQVDMFSVGGCDCFMPEEAA